MFFSFLLKPFIFLIAQIPVCSHVSAWYIKHLVGSIIVEAAGGYVLQVQAKMIMISNGLHFPRWSVSLWSTCLEIQYIKGSRNKPWCKPIHGTSGCLPLRVCVMIKVEQISWGESPLENKLLDFLYRVKGPGTGAAHRENMTLPWWDNKISGPDPV